jgi:hypothetical protein
MRPWEGRVRLAHAACALSAALLILPASRALGGVAVVRDIFIEEFAPVYPDARRRALERAMQDAVRSALSPPVGAARPVSVSPQRAESMVSFIEVHEETIRPEYYAIRVSIGLAGKDIHAPETPEDGPLPAVRTFVRGEQGVVPLRPLHPSGDSPGMRLGIKVPRGSAGALGAYRTLLAALDVQHVAIHTNPELLLDVTVKLRHRPAAMPKPSPDSGIVVTEEPPVEPAPVR